MFEKRTLLFSSLMATMMSLLIGSGITIVKTGFTGFFSAFAETAPVAFAIALPTSIFMTPYIGKIVTMILGPEGKG